MVHNRHTTTLAALMLFFYTIIIIMYHYCLLEKGLTPLFQSSFCPIELELLSMLFFLQLGRKLLPIIWKLVYLVEKMGKISVIYQSLAHLTLAIHILTLNLRGLSHQRFLFSLILHDCFRSDGSSLPYPLHSGTQVNPVVTISVSEDKEFSFKKWHFLSHAVG